jgi:hypothetical protein
MTDGRKPPDPTLPLAAASTRIKPERRKRKDSTLSRIEQGMALGMATVGVPHAKIAQALEIPKDVLSHQIERIPEYKTTILSVREKLKLTKIQRAWLLEEKLWNLADRLIDADDAKGVDGTLRALHASEKIQQAVAGEGQRLEVKTDQPTVVDLKVLIQTILNEP